MRHPDLDRMMLTERREDELRAAHQARLAREAQSGSHSMPRREAPLVARPRPAAPSLRIFALMLARSLAYLGERLLAWSMRLQCRYQVLAAGSEGSGPCG